MVQAYSKEVRVINNCLNIYPAGKKDYEMFTHTESTQFVSEISKK
jgi:hypothetical protein